MDTWPSTLDRTVYWRSWWLEAMPAGQVQPPDIFTAMRATRGERLRSRSLLEAGAMLEAGAVAVAMEGGAAADEQAGEVVGDEGGVGEVHGPHPVDPSVVQMEQHLVHRRRLAQEAHQQAMATWAQLNNHDHDEDDEGEEEEEVGDEAGGAERVHQADPEGPTAEVEREAKHQEALREEVEVLVDVPGGRLTSHTHHQLPHAGDLNQ